MNFSKTFIDRPIATALLMSAILLAGLLAFTRLPVARRRSDIPALCPCHGMHHGLMKMGWRFRRRRPEPSSMQSMDPVGASLCRRAHECTSHVHCSHLIVHHRVPVAERPALHILPTQPHVVA